MPVSRARHEDMRRKIAAALADASSVRARVECEFRDEHGKVHPPGSVVSVSRDVALALVSSEAGSPVGDWPADLRREANRRRLMRPHPDAPPRGKAISFEVGRRTHAMQGEPRRG